MLKRYNWMHFHIEHFRIAQSKLQNNWKIIHFCREIKICEHFMRLIEFHATF